MKNIKLRYFFFHFFPNPSTISPSGQQSLLYLPWAQHKHIAPSITSRTHTAQYLLWYIQSTSAHTIYTSQRYVSLLLSSSSPLSKHEDTCPFRLKLTSSPSPSRIALFSIEAGVRGLKSEEHWICSVYFAFFTPFLPFLIHFPSKPTHPPPQHPQTN